MDEKITEGAAEAVKNITAELAEEVDIDKRYRTLGGSRIFRSRCSKPTSDILANAARLALYKAPGHRGTAAKALGQTGDSRVLPFLHHRLPIEQNRKTRIAIAEAIGRIGHESSIDILKERAVPRGRYLSKEGEAMVNSLGAIYHSHSKEILIELLKHDGNTTRSAVIQALSNQDPTNLVDLISPYLASKSRPVVRASILALTDLGSEGESVIREKAGEVIKKIGYDKPSKSALIRMLGVSGVSEMKPVHKYFAKRIEKLGKETDYLKRQSNRSYSYWWRRREYRTRERLLEYLKMASTHLSPPFDDDLVNSIRTVLRDENDLRARWAPEKSQLARVIMKEQIRETVFEQTFLSSYRW